MKKKSALILRTLILAGALLFAPQSIFAEGSVADPFYTIASSIVDCDFRDLFEKQEKKCELSLVYEKNQNIASLFLFKSRNDQGNGYANFVKNNKGGKLVQVFDLQELFAEASEAGKKPFLSVSALFQEKNKIQFKARFKNEGQEVEQVTVEY